MKQLNFLFREQTSDFLNGLFERCKKKILKKFPRPTVNEEYDEYREMVGEEVLLEYAYSIIEHFNQKEHNRRSIIGIYKEK